MPDVGRRMKCFQETDRLCRTVKITNLGAVKIIFRVKWFVLYLVSVMVFSLIAGVVVNLAV